MVLRLKGGDPFVFGRGAEELELLALNNIPFEVVPGITSAVAVPAYSGIPVTHRDYTSSFHVITGHPRSDGQDRIDYDALVRMKSTLVFLMSFSVIGEVTQSLIRAGMDKNTPAAVIGCGTLCTQRNVISTVEAVEMRAKAADIQMPSVLVVGNVCQLAHEFAWYEKRPLAGRKILVTGTRSHAGRISDALRMFGAQVLEIPMVETKMLPAEEQKLELMLDHPKDKQMWLVFTSQVGVESFVGALAAKNLDMRCILNLANDVRFAGIGSVTAKRMREYGFPVDVVPKESNGHQLGIELGKKARKDALIYLLRSREAERDILDELDRHSLAWRDLAIYATTSRESSWMAPRLRQQFAEGTIDCVTFVSASAVKGFIKTVCGIDFKKVQAMCIGEQTAAEAEKYGMPITICDHASIDDMIVKIFQFLSR